MLFNWASREYNQSVDKFAYLPRATPPEKVVTLLPSLSSVESWFRPSDWSFARKDEPPDAPLLYVHMSLCTDATVIAIIRPHVVGDQFGMANIMAGPNQGRGTSVHGRSQ